MRVPRRVLCAIAAALLAGVSASAQHSYTRSEIENDARTGALLWRAAVGGIVQAAPMSCAVGSRQYVAIAAGNSLYGYGLKQ